MYYFVMYYNVWFLLIICVHSGKKEKKIKKKKWNAMKWKLWKSETILNLCLTF